MMTANNTAIKTTLSTGRRLMPQKSVTVIPISARGS